MFLRDLLNTLMARARGHDANEVGCRRFPRLPEDERRPGLAGPGLLERLRERWRKRRRK